MTFSELIKSRREELGLTLDQVAQFVGVNKSTILKWETGEINNPRRDRISLLAEILQLPPVELVKDESDLPDDHKNLKKAAPRLSPESKLSPLDQQVLDLLGKFDDEQKKILIRLMEHYSVTSEKQ